MITGQSAGFQTMIVSTVQNGVHVKIQIDLPAGSYTDFSVAATQLNVAEQIVTDLPDASRLESGFPNMTASFTLAGLIDYSGTQMSVLKFFGKYSTASPMYRNYVEQCPVRIYLGLEPVGAAGVVEYSQVFTGIIDQVSKSTDGSAQFTCLDNHALLNAIADTPPVVTAPPYNAGLTSEFALDWGLRKASNYRFGTWPAVRSNCLLAAGFRSSIWPEIGTLDTSSNQPVGTFAAGRFGSGLESFQLSPTGGFSTVTYVVAPTITTTIFMECWLTPVGTPETGFFVLSPPVILDGFEIEVFLNSGAPFVQITGLKDSTVGTTPNFASAAGARYVGVAITLGGGHWSAVVTCDSATANLGPLTFTGTPSSWTRFTAGPEGCVIEALQLTTESAPVSNATFVPDAVLDPSLNNLTVIPEISGDFPTMAQAVAEAELGVCRFTAQGIFRFYNRKTIRTSPIVRTLTSKTTIEGYGESATAASVVNRAQISYSLWSFAATASSVYAATGVIKVPAGQTIAPIIVTLSSLATQLDLTVAKAANGAIVATASQYRASTDASGLSEHSGCNFVITPVTSQTASMVISNPAAQDAYLVSPSNYSDLPAGTPLLTIAGIAVTQSDVMVADYQYPWLTAIGSNGLPGAAGSRWGEQPYQAQSSDWNQDAGSALALALDIVNDGVVPRPDITNLTIFPDWRFECTDRVQLADSDTEAGVNEYAMIFGSTIDWPEGGDLSQTIDARTIQAPGLWILGITGRSELSLTTYI